MICFVKGISFQLFSPLDEKEPDAVESSSSNSSLEEMLLYYNKTNLLFFFSGLVIMFLNALLLFIIFKLRRRKKYFIIISSVCISVFLHGAGYLTASFQRYLVHYLSWLFTETWKCSFWPHLLLLDLGEKGSCLFFFILTLDRFLSVIFSNYCRLFTAKNCSKLIINLYVMLILESMALVAWRCLGKDGRTIILGFCYHVQFFSADYYFYHCMIMAVVRNIGEKITTTFFDIQQRRDNVVLKKLTHMMLCTLLIHTVPLILLFATSFHVPNILHPLILNFNSGADSL
ncbi:G-protein coupled receptor [Trichinella spiralis]|uniref:G-protein coupled receptor n=1 Tax=Trichinella spiralis TaxID=6334 RepID=A0ABR3KUN2_TRISP